MVAIRSCSLALLCALLLPVAAQAAEPGPADKAAPEGEVSYVGRNAFEVWKEEHRWFRLGFRAYSMFPTIQENAALKVGAGLQIPLTTDFFMGLGMKLSFIGGYNRGGDTQVGSDKYCVNRGGDSGDLNCPDGSVGGVTYEWREPIVSTSNDCNGARTPSDTQPASSVTHQRRLTHVAHYALTIGGNYELTIPNLQVFRIFQPFVGGGVVLQWAYNYSDINSDECYLIDNEENDPVDPDNVDPWASQGPRVGGEVYGGFHLNLGRVFRFAFEIGYQNVPLQEASLKKATPEFEMKQLAYNLAILRLGGGIEFRF